MSARRRQSALLCSRRQAGALLGVGRGDSLDKLIASGALRPVQLLGRTYIPREQIEELARKGDKPVAPKKRQPRKPKHLAGGRIADVVI